VTDENGGMKNLYSDLAGICHLFYKHYFPHERIAERLDRILQEHGCKKIVFIGGLIYVAKILQQKGYKITFVDYTPEMLAEAKIILGKTKTHLGDMRSLSLRDKYDAILAIGRSFTYMYNDGDAVKALTSFRHNLKVGGITVIDNYETGKIDVDHYFNGTIKTKLKNTIVKRTSKIRQRQKTPALYLWDCVYSVRHRKKSFNYEDMGHSLRSFTKKELEKLITKSGLKFVSHFPNFERKSFISIGQK
jgi:ubiquinone/menaquinone biosynthesis C-methylase UbiE